MAYAGGVESDHVNHPAYLRVFFRVKLYTTKAPNENDTGSDRGVVSVRRRARDGRAVFSFGLILLVVDERAHLGRQAVELVRGTVADDILQPQRNADVTSW